MPVGKVSNKQLKITQKECDKLTRMFMKQNKKAKEHTYEECYDAIVNGQLLNHFKRIYGDEPERME